MKYNIFVVCWYVLLLHIVIIIFLVNFDHGYSNHSNTSYISNMGRIGNHINSYDSEYNKKYYKRYYIRRHNGHGHQRNRNRGDINKNINENIDSNIRNINNYNNKICEGHLKR